MGPKAGWDLANKISEETSAGTDQEHIETIVVSLPARISDRTGYILGETKINPVSGILDSLELLARCDVDLVAMACNTAHAPEFIETISQNLISRNYAFKLVNMIEATYEYILENFKEAKRIGILGTNGLVKSDVYGHYFRQVGLEAVYPDSSFQNDLLHPSIYDKSFGIKSSSNVQEQALENIEKCLKHIIEKNVHCVLLACTELPIAIKDSDVNGVAILDVTRILARELVRQSRQ